MADFRWNRMSSHFPCILTGSISVGGVLVVRSRPRGERIPGSKPDSTEEPQCKRVWLKLNPSGPNVLPLVWCGSLERGCKLRCRPRHLTTVQNYEVCPKIPLVLIQNAT
ncbi:hypothetical protein AVEN_180277-1 [Araneus ventricosus]|uniref:Uncharacterized protein n=1 Tax=Araneus ventricosus TaxID=182803 RepID=A0A4Y2STT3_ARAVE|nr:hypothetical protein AVEN_180277-1 [Araneus ventricosus]